MKPARASLGQPVGASLGRPVAITRAAGSDPDWADRSPRAAPPAALAGQTPRTATPATMAEQAGYREEARVPRPGEVIAASTQPAIMGGGVIPAGGAEIPQPNLSLLPEEPGPEMFASDRRFPPPLVKPSIGGEIVQTGNWSQPYPAELPPPPPPMPGDIPPLDDAPGGPAPRFYLGAEYLLWWTKHDKTPPLVTTSTNPADAGFLDRPSTVVLVGGDLRRDPFSGARFTGGFWLDDCQKKGIEFSGFFLGQRSARADINSSQFPVITRPFQELNRGTEIGELVAFPGAITGRATVDAPSELWGLEANYRCCLSSCCDRQVNLLAGARYLNLKESITITENVVNGPTIPPPLTNTSSVIFDSFATRNQFYGGQMGLETRWLRGNWSLDLRGKVALGVTHQEININGGQRVTSLTTGQTNNFVGGLLALPGANIGTFNRDRFSVVPEVGVTLGYQVTRHMRATVGYNFLYWSNVVRPGDQIDRVLDVTRIPNFTVPAGVTQRTDQVRPMVPFKETDFWAQGMTVGLEFNW